MLTDEQISLLILKSEIANKVFNRKYEYYMQTLELIDYLIDNNLEMPYGHSYGFFADHKGMVNFDTLMFNEYVIKITPQIRLISLERDYIIVEFEQLKRHLKAL